VGLSEAGGLTVAGLEAPRSLVLHYRMDLITAAAATEGSRAVLDWTWAFVLEPTEIGCRLLVRVRANPRPSWFELLFNPSTFWWSERCSKQSSSAPKISIRARRVALLRGTRPGDSRTAYTCHRHGSVLAGSACESTDRQPQETRQTTNLAAAQTEEVREATLGSSKSRHQPGGCRPSCGGQPRVQVLMDQILRSDGHLPGGYLEWRQNVGRRRPVSVMHVPAGSPAALTPKATTHRPGTSIGEFWQIS
jgi:hypothetical protein